MFTLMPGKKNQAVLSLWNDLSSLVLQNRSPKYWRTIRNTFGLFEKHFSKANEPKKSPDIYFKPKSFRTIFEKRRPVYSLAAPLLGLAKSICYTFNVFTVSLSFVNVVIISFDRHYALSRPLAYCTYATKTGKLLFLLLLWLMLLFN